jgi:hypothetical protein
MPVPKRRPGTKRPAATRKPDAIKKASESEHIFMGLYSLPGVGKTRLIGTLTEMYPNRVLMVKPPTDHTESLSPEAKRLLDVWTVSDHSELTDVLEYMRHDGGKDYDWIWIDSLTLLIDHCLDGMWDDIIAEKPHRAKFNLDKGEYYNNMVRLSRVARHLIGRDQFNFGWTAHTMDGEMPDGTELLVPQIHVRGMWSKFCAMMNIVAYYEKKTLDDGVAHRILRVQETDGYYAKNQLGDLPKDRMVDPTMPRLLAALRGEDAPASSKPMSAKAKARARLRNK